jgi:hypothetical protein
MIKFLIFLKGAIVRNTVLTLSLLCLVSLAKAQEPAHDPTNPYSTSTPRVGVIHHKEMLGQFVPEVTFVGLVRAVFGYFALAQPHSRGGQRQTDGVY